ncbi:MAG: SurA N-terminal domain-containing protein [Acidobacteria bacterium]|nr:SurA N-terminal domain-containing protein [Acidobacteriota bacterium]
MRNLLQVLLMILVASPGLVSQARVVDRIVAQVNDDIITLSDINREMGELRQELATRYAGDQLEQEVKKAEKMVLEELIRQKLLLQKANELGFGANIDLQVTSAIENIRKQNNIKDMQEFERALAQQGMTMVGFRERIRRQMLTQGLVQEFVSSRITLLSQEIERYYRDHAANFTTPEEVTLSEIIIPFGANPAEAESRAGEIHARLSQGESFATLASQYSQGPTASKGGGIGSYMTAKLNPEITAAIANVREGNITSVQKSKDGFIIYRVDTRKPAAVRPLEEVRDEIRNRLWEQKFNPEFEKFIAQLKEDAYIQIFAETKEP